jgi:hypothetical protein
MKFVNLMRFAMDRWCVGAVATVLMGAWRGAKNIMTLKEMVHVV